MFPLMYGRKFNIYEAVSRKIVLLLLLIVHSLYSYETISPETLTVWITGGAPFEFLLIDIREPYELTTTIGSGSCGAYNFPYNSGIFDKMIGSFPYDTAMVIYCASGSRSSMACSKLQSAGFSKLYHLKGGVSRFQGPTLPGDLSRPVSDFPEVFCDRETSVFVLKNDITGYTHRKQNRYSFNLQGRNCENLSAGITINADRTGLNHKTVLLIRAPQR